MKKLVEKLFNLSNKARVITLAILAILVMAAIPWGREMVVEHWVITLIFGVIYLAIAIHMVMQARGWSQCDPETFRARDYFPLLWPIRIFLPWETQEGTNHHDLVKDRPRWSVYARCAGVIGVWVIVMVMISATAEQWSKAGTVVLWILGFLAILGFVALIAWGLISFVNTREKKEAEAEAKAAKAQKRAEQERQMLNDYPDLKGSHECLVRDNLRLVDRQVNQAGPAIARAIALLRASRPDDCTREAGEILSQLHTLLVQDPDIRGRQGMDQLEKLVNEGRIALVKKGSKAT